MDVMMPGLDGLAATRAIRALASPVRDIPIIALTASAFVEDRAAAFEAGVNGFATNPITSLGLMEAIQSCKIEPGADTARTASLDDRVLAQLRRDLGEAHIGTALDLFKTDVTHRSARLRNSLAEPATMRKEAHALKGSAASFGFLRLAEAAARVEAAARGSDPGLISLAENLLEEAAQVPALLEKHEGA
jgi:CheY-like chemotaxis protein